MQRDMKSDYMQLLVAAKGICTSKIGGDVPEKAASRLQTQVIGGDALQPAAAFLLSDRFFLLLLRLSDPSSFDVIIDLGRILLLLLFSFITRSFLRKVSALPWNLCQNI